MTLLADRPVARSLTTIDEHARALAQAQARLGRPLTVGERHIDIVALDRDLKEGKLRLAAAIDKEKRRALNAYFRYKRTIKLDVTPQMLKVLDGLYYMGRRHAANEIKLLTGVKLPRSYSQRDDIEALHKKLHAQLRPFQQKVVHHAVGADIGSIAEIAATRAVLQMPGALNVASQLVSSAAFAGVGSVYDENAGLFSAFMYSAVMDDNTCEECEAHDGEEFESWDALMEVLPDGGPNPDCFGEGRCRCRGVPSEMSLTGAIVGDPNSVFPSEGLIEDAGGTNIVPPEIRLLPKHAQQPVETLTQAEAAAQLKKLEGNIRGLHWHAKNGRPLNPQKLAAYEQRVKDLEAHIKGGAAPRPVPPIAPLVLPVEPVPAPFVAPGNPFVGQTKDELNAALRKRNNQIAGVKKRMKAAGGLEGNAPVDLRIRLTQLEAERERIREALKIAPTTRAVEPTVTATGEHASSEYFSAIQKPTTRSKAYDTRKQVDSAMTIMDRVFVKYHDEGAIDKISLGFKPSRNAYGTYYHGRSIEMLGGGSWADTFWHEFGHFIDYQGLGTSAFRSRYMASMSETVVAADNELTPVFDAIKTTHAFAKVEAAVQGRSASSFVSKSHARYLSSKRELFARSFAQYVHRKGEELNEQGLLNEEERQALMQSRFKMERRARDEYGTQWSDEDFDPIYDALDNFFRTRGWLR